MRIIHVWGFSRDERGRAIARAVRNQDLGERCVGSYRAEGVPLNCQVRFGRPSFEFDPETKRPYILFADGRVKSVQLDLSRVDDIDADEVDVRFLEHSVQPAELRWDLSNAEIQDLVGKGLFGFDYDFDPDEDVNPKPVEPKLSMPRFFTENDMDVEIPCDVHVAFMAHQGRVVPVAAVFPNGTMSLRTNTRLAECEPISDWFDEPRFLAAGDYSETRDMRFSMDEPEFLNLLDRLEAETEAAVREEKVPEEKPYIAALAVTPEPEPVLTDEQKALRDLSARVDERVGAAVPGAPENTEAPVPARPETPAPERRPEPRPAVSGNEGAAARVVAAQEDAEARQAEDGEYLDFD